MGLTTALLTVLLGQCIAYEIFEEEKRQQLYPFPRIGRSSIWDFVEDKRLGGLMPFPRVGRNDGKRQGLIPFPRIGRSIGLDYDDTDVEEWLDDSYDVSTSPLLKRASKIAFQPRIGRRKRSINPDEESHQMRTESSTIENQKQVPWQLQYADGLNGERAVYYGPSRQFFGPPMMVRGMFEPRIGKKLEDVVAGENFDKRALVPRVGRADPSIQTRAMLQPRVGRALIPRVGRSGNPLQQSTISGSQKSKN